MHRSHAIYRLRPRLAIMSRRRTMIIMLCLIALSTSGWYAGHSMLQSEKEKRARMSSWQLPSSPPTTEEPIDKSKQKYQPWNNRRKYTMQDATNRKKIFKEAAGKTDGKVGIVTFVGNNKYCDGALVLGFTAKESSDCGEGKWCRTGVLVSNKVSPTNTHRLSIVFDDIFTVNNSLAKSVKGTPWGSTFDKFYLWSLTRYEFIVFYDADMVLNKNTATFYKSLSLPSENHWIAALGTTGGYFATGTVVLRPNATILDELLGFYHAVLKNDTDKWGFRGPNARDGLVMRYFIAGRVIPIDGIPGHHLSGAWKPWYNIKGDYSEVKDFRKIFTHGEPARTPQYEAWWDACVRMHKKVFMEREQEIEAYHEEWGMKSSPKTHIWMLRETKWQYLYEIQ
eukprot:TRINITY_DN2484_c0_g1_i1.p1 TRINITY_DN2484_c0_g1~~TRINITY_DN2484_c0_g1_i1.p1  ORF type:complete len:395 (+),score=47.13 TRINITY_DN2484_c0_g1_i1:123-1307(+)